MRLLTVRHLTVYRYSEPVELGEHRMMFRPRASHDLRLIRTDLAITPRPANLHWLHDVFDNSVAVATFKGRTKELSFDSTVSLEHYEASLPDYQLAADAAHFPFQYSREERPELARALARTRPDPDIDKWADGMRIAYGSLGTMELLRGITLRIREQLNYVRRTERGVQGPGETLKRGTGTCRDFAWMMIDVVRALGFAARFVSGYIFVPNASGSSVIGGGATHAWLQVYLPGAGWVDFDPTNSIIGNRNLIRVAMAWDPTHVLPLWGTFTGRRGCFLGMDVTVAVTEQPDADDETENEVEHADSDRL